MNRPEDAQIDPHIYYQLIVIQSHQGIQWSKESFQQMTLKQLGNHVKKQKQKYRLSITTSHHAQKLI